jgi:hypothetical protein
LLLGGFVRFTSFHGGDERMRGGKIHCGTSWLNNERESDVINLVISATFLIFFKVSSRISVVEIKGRFWRKPAFASDYRAINQSQIKIMKLQKSTGKIYRNSSDYLHEIVRIIHIIT